MGRQIIKQPNGKYAVWSTVVDDFILVDALPEDIVSERVQESSERIRKDVTKVIEDLNNGKRPYYQFTVTFEEAVRKIKELHGDAVSLKLLGKES